MLQINKTGVCSQCLSHTGPATGPLNFGHRVAATSTPSKKPCTVAPLGVQGAEAELG